MANLAEFSQRRPTAFLQSRESKRKPARAAEFAAFSDQQDR